MNCTEKHTKPDIPDDAWKCPSCGIGADHKSGGFVIDMDSLDACEKLHDNDSVSCYGCGYGTTGRAFARQYAKSVGLVPCKHCKGAGMVKKA